MSSTSSEKPKTYQPRAFLIVGRIGAPHGLSGEVRVTPMTNDPERFAELVDCFILSRDESQQEPARVASSRVFPDHVLIRLAGVDDRDAAVRLNGCYIAVDRAHAVALPENSWFICDLIGCTVHDTRHGLLGEVHDVLQNAGQDLVVVRQSGAKDLLFPLRADFLIQVDLDARRMDVALPDGLYEVYR